MTDPIRVLICDDQVLIRTGLSTIIDAQPDLEVAGECGDGRTAVDLARKLRPDVVVMDIRMPVLDGIAATRLLMRRRGGTPGQGPRGDDVQPGRVRLRGAAPSAPAASSSRTRPRTGCSTASGPWP